MKKNYKCYLQKVSIRNFNVSLIGLIIFLIQNTWAQEYKINIPEIDGIDVTLKKSVLIESPLPAKTALAFKFQDGRIVVGNKNNSMWSYDNGYTWDHGKESKMDKAAIDLGGGEIISVNRNSQRRVDGKFDIGITRSYDNWNTTIKETAELDIPKASYTITGSGGRVDGFLFHHGLIQLEDGTLVGSMYGNFEGDTELCAGYPAELGQRKYHTIVVFSKDKGRTWGNYSHVAYNKMLGRGIPDDHKMVGKSIPKSRVSKTTIVPAITSEGFRESDIVQAANGDIICIMRSGGRNPVPGTHLFPTPLYCSRSLDNGKTWTPPEQIADRGTCPSVIKLANGILVSTYGRPGNWLIFSDDNGLSWKGAFQFGNTGSTNYLVETEPNTIQVYHEVEENGVDKVRGTIFQVIKK